MSQFEDLIFKSSNYEIFKLTGFIRFFYLFFIPHGTQTFGTHY